MAIVGLLTVGAAGPAQADNVSQIANGLRSSHLYVSSEAQGVLSVSDRDEIEKALVAKKDADIKVVVTRAGPSVRQLGPMLRAVEERVGKGDVYLAVTADDRMTAIAKKDVLSGKEINQAIAQASPGSDIRTRVIAFADNVEKKVSAKQSSSRTTAFVILGVVILVIAGVIGAFLVVRKRARDRTARQMAELKQSVQEDVTLLGEDIARLNLNVTDPNLPDQIRDDYTKALDSYDAAKQATEQARRPEEMTAVTKALEDGRYYMTAVRARLGGYPVPERRPPCFFNPQHGPSVQDVTWAPPGGAPRSVPACQADAQRVLSGEIPDSRMVYADGQHRPYWDAGPAYVPYAGGYYSGFGGFDMLGGLLLGTALGSMLSGGFGGGWGGDPGGGWGGDSGGDFGGFGGDSGDAGGGWDFGSGDFGGGGSDWGGGGGDW
jgi:hypothetical protein